MQGTSLIQLRHMVTCFIFSHKCGGYSLILTIKCTINGENMQRIFSIEIQAAAKFGKEPYCNCAYNMKWKRTKQYCSRKRGKLHYTVTNISPTRLATYMYPLKSMNFW